ncbi:hypothetical protein ACIBO9_02645 [Streptomyces prunicolor]|uniref:hypothetical protein n=1 Tax=Streptomyces prunicolor TaxID=67348 RepID=UPI0037D74AEF
MDAVRDAVDVADADREGEHPVLLVGEEEAGVDDGHVGAARAGNVGHELGRGGVGGT